MWKWENDLGCESNYSYETSLKSLTIQGHSPNFVIQHPNLTKIWLKCCWNIFSYLSFREVRKKNMLSVMLFARRITYSSHCKKSNILVRTSWSLLSFCWTPCNCSLSVSFHSSLDVTHLNMPSEFLHVCVRGSACRALLYLYCQWSFWHILGF